MINAEELGIDFQEHRRGDEIEEAGRDALHRHRGRVRRGARPDQGLGARIVRHVGNYGEIYERNLGSGSKLGIPRGLNQLWNIGGILYAPPIR